MTIHRSAMYTQIHDRVHEDYLPTTQSEWPGEQHWLKNVAPQWRNRVGMPRLVAESVLLEAWSLLNSVNAGIFRNDPEGLERLRAAQEAASQLASEFSRENWRRFKGKEQS